MRDSIVAPLASSEKIYDHPAADVTSAPSSATRQAPTPVSMNSPQIFLSNTTAVATNVSATISAQVQPMRPYSAAGEKTKSTAGPRALKPAVTRPLAAIRARAIEIGRAAERKRQILH